MRSPAEIEVAKQLYAKCGDLDRTLRELRTKGWDQIDCVLFIRTVLNIDLSHAKRLPHESAAWVDMREANEKVWDMAEQAFRDLGGTDDPTDN